MRELREVPEPGVMEIGPFGLSAGLGIIPVHIGTVHVGRRIAADAAHTATGESHQDAIGREERHLGVVADQGTAFRIQFETSDPLFPIALQDRLPGHEFHGIAERITGRASHQGATATVSEINVACLRHSIAIYE